jgi:ATP-dependent exoDNAse (exonuclease V) beta subunit
MSLNVYKSSAGSGKTYTLVLEYLGIVLQQPNLFRKILAVTFTNKAANEMKARVLKSLWILSHSDNEFSDSRKSLINNLKKSFELDEVTITKNAHIVFSYILHFYSDFNISTIDSFSHRIVRTFTRDLRLPLQFEVELDSGQLAQIVSDTLMSRIGTDEFVTQTILNFALIKMEDETDWQIERQLKSFIVKLLKEDAFLENRNNTTLTEADFVEIRKIIPEEIKSFEEKVKGYADKMLKLLSSQEISIFELNGKSKGIGPIIQKLSDTKITDVFEQKSIHNYFENEKSIIGEKSENRLKAAFSIIESEFYEALIALKDCYDKEYKRYVLLKLLNKNIYSFSLSSQISNVMYEIGLEKQLVHISEFNKSIAGLLQKVAVPFIYERLGERFSHFLLDEFQDTSVLQWQNFLPLIENSLANGNLNLIVGDGKQSIYRFRSGEVEQFLILPEVFKKEGNLSLHQSEDILNAHYKQIDLSTNYRSAGGIVEANNSFFDFVKQFLPQKLQKVYENQSQSAIKPANEGLTSIAFLEDLKDAKKHIQMNLDKTLETVELLISEGYQYKDIAVLTRSNKNGNEIARHLANNNIKVVSSDSLLLNSSLKVRLLVNAMTFYLYPDEKINRTELICNLVEHSQAENESFPFILSQFGGLTEEVQISELSSQLNIDIIDSPGLSVYDFFESLVRLLGFDSDSDPYVQFFLDEVFKFQINERKDAVDFLEYWEKIIANKSIIVPDTTNAVKVMTIHKAKGLEFPVVVFPFADMKVDLSRLGDRWIDLREENIGKLESCILGLNKQLQSTRYVDVYDDEVSKTKLDLMNLLYVVMTRPIERLYIFTTKPEEKETFSCPWFYKAWLQKKELWEEDKAVYEIGNLNAVKSETGKIAQSSESTYKFISKDWKIKLYIAPESGPFENNKVKSYALDIGILTHILLSEIIFEKDIDHAISRFQESGLLDSFQAEMFSGQIKNLIAHSQLNYLFNGNISVKTEAEIMSDEGKIYRIDRYVKTEDEVILVDYKTGKYDHSHETQILKYIELAENLQKLPVKGLLVYLDDVITVDEFPKKDC